MDSHEKLSGGNTEERPVSELSQEPDFSTHMEQTSQEPDFFETKVLLGNNLMPFQELLKNADPDQTREIIQKRLAFLEETSTKRGDIVRGIHEGFISRDTRVHFQYGPGNPLSGYKIKNTDYIHDMIGDMQRNREDIRGSLDFFVAVELFLNSYFGYPPLSDTRSEFAYRELEKTGDMHQLSDDDWWDRIENVDISVFKGQEIAMCTERASMAQNILTFFGYEVSYVSGSVEVDGETEHHAFNVITNPWSGNRHILDFSMTSSIEKGGLTRIHPTMSRRIGDYEEFLHGQKIPSEISESHILPDGTKNKTTLHSLRYRVS